MPDEATFAAPDGGERLWFSAPTRLAYSSLVDFVPGVEPYTFLTVVDLEPSEGGVHVVMTVEAMHDEVWTERLLAGRTNELDNLAAVVEGQAS